MTICSKSQVIGNVETTAILGATPCISHVFEFIKTSNCNSLDWFSHKPKNAQYHLDYCDNTHLFSHTSVAWRGVESTL